MEYIVPFLLLSWTAMAMQPSAIIDRRPQMVARQRNIPFNPPIATYVKWYCGGNITTLRLR